jgi:hypothetical protein
MVEEERREKKRRRGYRERRRDSGRTGIGENRKRKFSLF